MKLNKKGANALFFGAVAASSLLLVACGGGGGGGDSSPSSVTYTGVTTAASIDNEAAAVNFSEAAVSGSFVASSSVPLFGVSSVSGGVPSVERLRNLAETVMKLDYASATNDSLVGASESGKASGCTGSASMIVNYDDLDYSGDLTAYDRLVSASVTFTNYREPDEYGSCDTYTMTYNGSATITVLYEDPVDDTWITGMTLSTPYMATTDASGATERMTGSFTLSMYPGTDVTLTMSADYQDATGVVYRVKNYKVVISLFEGITSVNGILCDPAKGCIEIVTTTPFSVATCSPSPDSGTLTIYGYDWGSSTRDASKYITVDAATGDCSTYQVCWVGTTSGCVDPDPTW